MGPYKPNWPDILRCIGAVLSTIMLLAPNASWPVRFASLAISIFCIVSARDRRGPIIGVSVVIIVRVVVGLILRLFLTPALP